MRRRASWASTPKSRFSWDSETKCLSSYRIRKPTSNSETPLYRPSRPPSPVRLLKCLPVSSLIAGSVCSRARADDVQLEGAMPSPLAEKAIQEAQLHGKAILKFISANDCG